MPLRFVVEAVIEAVVEFGARALGYWTGCLLVPLLSLGRYRVAAVQPAESRALRRERRERSRRSASHRDGPAAAEPGVVSADTAVLVGLMFWVGMLVLAFWLALRP
jgi:hypothetical protein